MRWTYICDVTFPTTLGPQDQDQPPSNVKEFRRGRWQQDSRYQRLCAADSFSEGFCGLLPLLLEALKPRERNHAASLQGSETETWHWRRWGEGLKDLTPVDWSTQSHWATSSPRLLGSPSTFYRKSMSHVRHRVEPPRSRRLFSNSLGCNHGLVGTLEISMIKSSWKVLLGTQGWVFP